MTDHFTRFLVPVVLSIALATPAGARETNVGSLSITGPWARETARGQTVGGGFVTIVNRAPSADRLVAASSPVATETQLHTMTMTGGVMRMRLAAGGIAVPSRGTLKLDPGGFHIMFVGLKHPLKRGDRFPVTLRFEHAGSVTITFVTEAAGAMGPSTPAAPSAPMKGMSGMSGMGDGHGGK